MELGGSYPTPPCRQCCGAGAGFGGSLIKLPPGAGAGSINSELRIRNYLIFIKDLKKMLGKKFNILSFFMSTVHDNIIFLWAQKFPWDPDLAGPVINWPPGSGSVSQSYGSAEPKPNFTDPQHCCRDLAPMMLSFCTIPYIFFLLHRKSRQTRSSRVLQLCGTSRVISHGMEMLTFYRYRCVV
jgi:hypothetical protein